jgi:hypothetical protein
MPHLLAAQYVTLSWRKVEIARRHLIELERELQNLMVNDPASPTDSRAAGEGHADGAVFQSYAAFDTYACGVAVHFGLAQPDKASLNGIVPRLEEPPPPFTADEVHVVASEIRAVTSSDGWRDLSFYRNLAAHSGVLAPIAHFSMDTGSSLRIGNLDGPDPNRSEVLPILHRLVGWVEETTDRLRGLADNW